MKAKQLHIQIICRNPVAILTIEQSKEKNL